MHPYQIEREASVEQEILPGIQAVIFDIDDTLVKAKNPEFYRQYGPAINTAIAEYLQVDYETGKMIADFFREKFGGGEQALFSGKLAEFFPQFTLTTPEFTSIYNVMCRLNPKGYFAPNEDVNRLIQRIKQQGIATAAVTSTAEGLSRRILEECDIDPDKDFDIYQAYTPQNGPPKMVLGKELFSQIATNLDVPLNAVLSIGDSYQYDIFPAASLGMKTCLIGNTVPEGYSGVIAPDVINAVYNFK